MDTVTYSNPTVRTELDHWLQIDVDVSAREQLTTLFGVKGIPVAIAMTGTGEELGRLLGFIEPGQFTKDVEGLRRAASQQR